MQYIYATSHGSYTALTCIYDLKLVIHMVQQ